tara:strand:- start:1172 stop:2050 length:879 start_codon:yes stop_codon:yes gene_type:complete
MTNFRIIPKLEIKNLNLVKGYKLEGLRVLGKPLDFIKIYEKNLADEIILEDVMASILNKLIETRLIKKIAQNSSIALCASGGVKSLSDAEKLFSSGSEKVCLCSALVKNPLLIKKISNIYGSQSTAAKLELVSFENNTISMTYLNGREVFNKNWKDWLSMLVDLGVGEIHLNFVDLDGTGKGPNLIITEQARNLSKVPIIYSGGISKLEHIKKLKEIGVDGVAIASALHYNLIYNKFISYNYNEKYFIRQKPNQDLGNYEWLFFGYGNDKKPMVDLLDIINIKKSIKGLRVN